MAKFQPGVLNPLVLICGCLLYTVCAHLNKNNTHSCYHLYYIVRRTELFWINVVVNFLTQVIFVFLLFLGMVIYANEVETKENKNCQR